MIFFSLRRAAAAAAFASASLGLMGAGAPQTTFVPISNPAGLTAFFEAQASGPDVRILHIGDSHIARDTFSGDLRTLFAARDKAGSRGMLPAGNVYPFYTARGVEIDMSDGWDVVRARNEEAPGPFGVMNARVTAEAGTSPWIALSGFETPVERLLIGYQRQPEGGVLQVHVDSRIHAVPTSGDQGFAFAALPVRKGTQIVRIAAAGDGPVALFSLVLEADVGGPVLSNSGWPGATAEIMARWDDDLLRMELGRLDPDLIIVGYGTNEGFDDKLDLGDYEAVLRAQLVRLKRFAPGASILLTGGPDGTRLPHYADTDAREPHEWNCAPLNAAERQQYVELIAEESEALLRWHDAPQLSAVLAVQKRVALDVGAAHWDWRAAMGGACAVHQWRLAEDPQLARPDHVHLTGDGYKASASALFEAINGAFVARQGDREGRPVPDRDKSGSGVTRD